MRITDEHLGMLRREGFVVVKNFLTADELTAARAGFHAYYPTAEELAAKPLMYGGIIEEADALQTEFPFGVDTLNHISTHPAILSGVKRFLGTEDIRLSQAAIWAKYAGYGAYEQGLHFDYQGNTLVVPRMDEDYQQVNFIIYYSDVTKGLGPTAVVPISETTKRKVTLWPAFKTRAKHPELYEIEKKIIVPAGSMLIFTMSTLHRATEMTASSGARYSHHLVYRSAKHDFQGYHQYSRMGEKEELQRFIQVSMREQREALGFPKPGDPYWTKETVKSVGMRYPELDMSEYRGK